MEGLRQENAELTNVRRGLGLFGEPAQRPLVSAQRAESYHSDSRKRKNVADSELSEASSSGRKLNSRTRVESPKV